MRLTRVRVAGSPVVEALRREDAAVAARFAGLPRLQESLARAVAGAEREARPRAELARLLVAEHERLGASPASTHNAARLAERDTLVVATGQQPGLLTGPLYTLFKAASAVAAARLFAERTGRTFVPVFWIASDDHDLGEIEGCQVLNDRAEVQRFRVPLGSDAISSSRLLVPPAARDEFERFVAALPRGPASDVLLDLAAPRIGERWPDWFARILLGLFRDDGLVVLEPSRCAALTNDWLLEELRTPQRMPQALAAGARSLRHLGLEAPLDPSVPSCVFVHQDDRRRRFDAGAMDSRAIEAALARDASILTPDAALRPILQARLLPAPVVIGGPGELAYWAQLTEAFDALGVPRPLLLPRFSGTILDAKVERAMRALGLTAADAFADESALRARIPPAQPDPELARRAQAAIEGVERLIDGLDRSADNARKKGAELRKAFGSSVERILKIDADARAEKSGTDQRRVDLVVQSVRPGGQPQERVLNGLQFVARGGVTLFHELASRIDPFDDDHHLVHLSSEEERDA